MDLIYLNNIIKKYEIFFTIFIVINKLLCLSHKNKIIKTLKIESQLLLIILLLNTFLLYF